jgi:hypothetical protein
MKSKPTLLAALFSVCAFVSAFAVTEKPIHPEADRILREMSDRLKAANQYSFKAEVWEDCVVAGHKVTATKTVDAQLQRPNNMHVEVRAPARSRGFWYDGHTLTVLDREKNLYATAVVPDTIEKMLDTATDRFGVRFPLEDLLVSDPYAGAMKGITGAAYFGKVNILGTPTQHIAFSTDNADCQLWLTDDSKLPRKLVITYKKEEAQPQVTAIFNEWNLKGQFVAKTFTFTPPAGAAKIEMLPAAVGAIR